MFFLELTFSFRNRLHLRKTLLSGEANRKSQKLSPFVKWQKSIELYLYTLKIDISNLIYITYYVINMLNCILQSIPPGSVLLTILITW